MKGKQSEGWFSLYDISNYKLDHSIYSTIEDDTITTFDQQIYMSAML
jgi:hypothetical protein